MNGSSRAVLVQTPVGVERKTRVTQSERLFLVIKRLTRPVSRTLISPTSSSNMDSWRSRLYSARIGSSRKPRLFAKFPWAALTSQTPDLCKIGNNLENRYGQIDPHANRQPNLEQLERRLTNPAAITRVQMFDIGPSCGQNVVPL